MAMAISFPGSPSTGDLFDASGRTWIYDGASWRLTSPASSATATFNWEPTTVELIDGGFQWFYGWRYDPATGRLELDEINDSDKVAIPSFRPGNVDGVYNGMLTSAELGSAPKHAIIDMYGEGYYNWFTSLQQITFDWDASTVSHITMEV